MSLIKRNNGGLFPSIFSDFFDSEKFLDSDFFKNEFKNFVPAVNIKENGNEFKVELSVPGFSKDDFKVFIEDDVLTISAEKKEEKEEKDEHYMRREFYQNSFSRSFSLPASAKDDVKAQYENGVLQLSIPKKEEAKASSNKKQVAIS